MPHCPDYENIAWNTALWTHCVLLRAKWKFNISSFTIWPSDSTWILPLRQLPKTPTKSHLEQTSPPSIAFLPASRETHSGRALPQSCSLRSPSWPLHSGSLCSHFQSPACHSGALPLASIPAQGSWNCLKSYEKAGPMSWTPIGSKEKARILTSLEPPELETVFFLFTFCFLFVI